MKPSAYISDGGILFKQSPPDSILQLNPLYTSAEIQALHDLVKEQQEKIDRLLDQYQRLNENLEMWKTGHFKQQAEIESLGKAFEGERKYARYLSKLCIDNEISIVWSF